jgi:hypothetical protein
MTPATRTAEPPDRLSADELERVAGIVFLAAELRSAAAVTPVLDEASPSDRAALHARELLFPKDKETHVASN